MNDDRPNYEDTPQTAEQLLERKTLETLADDTEFNATDADLDWTVILILTTNGQGVIRAQNITPLDAAIHLNLFAQGIVRNEGNMV